MAPAQAKVVGIVLIIESILTLFLCGVIAISSIKRPERSDLMSKKYWKLDLSALDKKIFTIAVPGALLLLITAVHFRGAFGLEMNYAGMVILLNLLAFDIMVLNISLFSFGVSVYYNERHTEPDLRRKTTTTNSNSPKMFDQARFEWTNSLILGAIIIVSTILQLKLNEFSMQAILYGASVIFATTALISSAFLWIKLRATTAFARKELSQGLDNQALKIRYLKSQHMEERMQSTVVTYTSVVGIYVAMFVLAIISSASPEQVWSSDGLQYSHVPDIHLLVLGSSFVPLVGSIILQNQKTKEITALESSHAQVLPQNPHSGSGKATPEHHNSQLVDLNVIAT
jgi:hypothetical protein